MYAFGVKDGRFFISLYVDCLLMVWKEREVLEMAKRRLQEKFEMKELGMAKKLLGIELRRHEGFDLLMVQQKYAIEFARVWHGEQQGSLNTFQAGQHFGGRGKP